MKISFINQDIGWYPIGWYPTNQDSATYKKNIFNL